MQTYADVSSSSKPLLPPQKIDLAYAMGGVFSRRGSSCRARILVSACLTTHETHALKFKMPCVHLRLVLVARGVGVRQRVHVPWERRELRTEEGGRRKGNREAGETIIIRQYTLLCASI